MVGIMPAEMSSQWTAENFGPPAPVPAPGLGQVAYEAYAQASDGVSLVTGVTLPGWADVKPEIQAAWQAAAAAVVGYLNRAGGQ
jgi:hypothetical protein